MRFFQRQQLAFDDLSQLHLLAQRIVGCGVVAGAAQLIVDLRQAGAGRQGVILLRQAALQLPQAQRAAYCLRKLGLATRAGMAGRAPLYRLVQAAEGEEP